MLNTSMDQEHPVTAQKDRFAWEQVDAPEAVLDLPDECYTEGRLVPESPGR
jgi:hypothetical protein